MHHQKLQAAEEEMKITDDERRFLDGLRDSGKINMMNVYPYLADTFEISHRDARELIMQWMHTK